MRAEKWLDLESINNRGTEWKTQILEQLFPKFYRSFDINND